MSRQELIKYWEGRFPTYNNYHFDGRFDKKVSHEDGVLFPNRFYHELGTFECFGSRGQLSYAFKLKSVKQ
jgi:hypothetical protein